MAVYRLAYPPAARTSSPLRGAHRLYRALHRHAEESVSDHLRCPTACRMRSAAASGPPGDPALEYGCQLSGAQIAVVIHGLGLGAALGAGAGCPSPPAPVSPGEQQSPIPTHCRGFRHRHRAGPLSQLLRRLGAGGRSRRDGRAAKQPGGADHGQRFPPTRRWRSSCSAWPGQMCAGRWWPHSRSASSNRSAPSTLNDFLDRDAIAFRVPHRRVDGAATAACFGEELMHRGLRDQWC